ncbi:MAG: ATP-binding cassette domain-containing protein [Planctomycetota bacterium]|nr:ATP-binding cassette domain-containing protein [Planctomycetota bacterium]MDA0931881.1 ATP-binding cassette domain-containing protein [Planctomycetota bacterium]MDA1221180.1 ATP-binding cassette domain-containing protein [Planctomycetota bacterium]
MTYAATLDHVTKRFGDHTAVHDLSLRIPAGSIYGFIGPNGAGKTTTIRMLMSIFYPDAGQIRVLGHDRPEVVKDRLGYLPEEKGLYKSMRVQEIVAYFGKLKGMSTREANERARDLLVRYGLGDWLQVKCQALSKGMGQKVQLLGTIIHNPELVILDEPFSGLDPVNMELMRSTILDMKREGRTVIFSTHVMKQAEEICDFVFMIHRSKKVFDGPIQQIKQSAGGGIHLAYDGSATEVFGELTREGLATRINDAGKEAEIHPAEGVDPQAILARLVGRVTVRTFDLREVSLHEIFVRKVRELSGEVLEETPR